MELRLRAEEMKRETLGVRLRAEEMKRETLELRLRAEERQLKKEQREEEEVEVLLISENDLNPTQASVSRKLFDSWVCYGFVLQAVTVSNGEVNYFKSFLNFEEIEPLSICEVVGTYEFGVDDDDDDDDE